MNAIKSIINHTTVTTLNLASNMISQAGLEMILDDLMKNNVLKSLDVNFFLILMQNYLKNAKLLKKKN